MSSDKLPKIGWIDGTRIYAFDLSFMHFFSLPQTVVLKVAMSCQGCAGAVQRALTKMEGLFIFYPILFFLL